MVKKKVKLPAAWVSYLRKAKALLAKQEPKVFFQVPSDGNFMFDMKYVELGQGCGTAGCILGLIQVMSRADGEELDFYALPRDQHEHLDRLFYPAMQLSYGNVTPKGAAIAIDRFLKTGKAKFLLREQQ